MKRLLFGEGGRPFLNDDLEMLQAELFAATEEQYAGLGAFILSGCAVSGAGPYDVAPGLVFIGGKIMRFAGAQGVALPIEVVQDTELETDARLYETGGLLNCLREYRTKHQAASGFAGEKITITAAGGRDIWAVTKDKLSLPPEVQEPTPEAPLPAGVTTIAGHAFSFYKDSFGYVHLQGQLTSSSTDDIVAMYTLPEGFRPSRLVQHPASVYGGQMGMANIFENGRIDVYFFQTTGRTVSLDGIRFYAGV